MQNSYRVCLLFGFMLVVGTGCAQSKPEKEIPYEALRVELEQIYDKDQGVRSGKMPTTPEEMKPFVKAMHQVDSLNQQAVLPMLQQYGWLPKSRIGEKAADALFLVVQHAPLPEIQKYLPQLKKLAKQGEASLIDAAMMEDRLLMYQGKKQVYGTQATSTVGKDGSMAIWPIEDPEKVNERRKAAGFTNTIEENAQRLNAAYNPKEELPANPHRFQ